MFVLTVILSGVERKRNFGLTPQHNACNRRDRRHITPKMQAFSGTPWRSAEVTIIIVGTDVLGGPLHNELNVHFKLYYEHLVLLKF